MRAKAGTAKTRVAKGRRAPPPKPTRKTAPKRERPRSAKALKLEEIIDALVAVPTLSAAAKVLRVTTEDLAGRIRDPETAAKLRDARIAAAEQARTRLTLAMPLAADGLVELAENSGPQDSVRMAALRGVLDLGEKVVERDSRATAEEDVDWNFPDFPIEVVGEQREEDDADDG